MSARLSSTKWASFSLALLEKHVPLTAAGLPRLGNPRAQSRMRWPGLFGKGSYAGHSRSRGRQFIVALPNRPSAPKGPAASSFAACFVCSCCSPGSSTPLPGCRSDRKYDPLGGPSAGATLFPAPRLSCQDCSRLYLGTRLRAASNNSSRHCGAWGRATEGEPSFGGIAGATPSANPFRAPPLRQGATPSTSTMVRRSSNASVASGVVLLHGYGGTSAPQYRHLVASRRISSAQYGHFFLSPLRKASASSFAEFFGRINTKRKPNGPSSMPARNHAQPLRPLRSATTALRIPNKNQKKISTSALSPATVRANTGLRHTCRKPARKPASCRRTLLAVHKQAKSQGDMLS